MRRRHFLHTAASAIGAGTLAARAPGLTRLTPAAAFLPLPDTIDATAFQHARRFAETRFGRIAYFERGTGDAALFLHGFPLNGFQWRGAIERLSPHRRCIAPDFLGLGYTELPDGQSVAPDTQVAMLSVFLDTLSVANVDLVASDSGGAVAQLFVAKHPERVRSLLLTNCDAEIDSPPPALLPVIAKSRAGTFVDEWLAPWLADKDLARSADGIGGMCYFDPAHPTDEAIETYFAPLVSSARRKAQVHAYAIALEPNPLAGIAAALRRSTAPTRIVWGTGDTIFSSASPEYLDRTFGNSRGVRRLPRRKLFWPEELPDVVAEEARALWGIA
jgi:pimeloyl-ACP methyl ester carboxylesterase